MRALQVSEELKDRLIKSQTRLESAICKHQTIYAKLQSDLKNVDLEKQLANAQDEVVTFGLEQKSILAELRKEYKAHAETAKTTIVKNGIEERKQNLTNSLVRTRKQNIVLKPSPQASFSEESNGESTEVSSPERFQPIEPHEIAQTTFLAYFGLATHETYKEMQNRRVERKRRSTANPHFLYGNKNWDFLSKRKRNNYLASSFSPPNTRQAVKKRNERISPPVTDNGVILPPTIPNLPSGLTIERVSPSSSPDSNCCTVCKKASGSLLSCEVCQNGFHVTCHNRPLPQTPKRCPRCYAKDVPVGLLMTAPKPSSQISEKVEEKKRLQEENKMLIADLKVLQERHSDLRISLTNQKNEQDELVSERKTTEDKIKRILNFVEIVKSVQVDEPSAE